MKQHQSARVHIDSIVQAQMNTMLKAHKQAVFKEHNKRLEKKKAIEQKKLEQEQEKRIRKEKRAALREKAKLDNLQDLILQEVIQTAELAEYNPKWKIYDIRDPFATNDGVIFIGGFVGELVITFTCLLDCIMANP